MRTGHLALAAATAVLVAGVAAPPRAAQAADPLPAGALRAVGTAEGWVTSSYQGWNWANPDLYYEYVTPGGDLGIVARGVDDDDLTVTTYDAATLAQVGPATTVSMQGWPDWGGFYAAPDGDLYVLVGRENPGEDDSLNVVAVRRYDPDWNLLGTAYVKGSATQGGVKGVYSPFVAGAAHMVLAGNRLVVHMARLIYAIAGVHHQVNLTFEVNTNTMTATTFDTLGGVSYSSHSFQQLVTTNGNALVMVDHGDAYPREIQLGVMASYPTSRTVSRYDLFDFNGAEGDNVTGASVTDLVSGPQGVVVLGNSIPQPDAPDGPLGSADEQRNAFAISATTTGAHSLHWLTQYAADGATGAGEVRAVQVGTDRYAVLFDVQDGDSDQLEYRLIDSAGTVHASASFPDVFYSTISEPVLVGHEVYWVGVGRDVRADPQTAYLFGVDVSDPTAPTLDRSDSQDFTTAPTPTISGTAQVGRQLIASAGSWAPLPDALGYRWYADGKAINGATGATLMLSPRQYHRTITVRVTAARAGYWTTSRTSSATASVTAGETTPGKPVITGKVTVGTRLTGHPGTWSPSGLRFSYQWYAAGTRIKGATHAIYRLSRARLHQRVWVVVTGRERGYRTTSAASKHTAKVGR